MWKELRKYYLYDMNTFVNTLSTMPMGSKQSIKSIGEYFSKSDLCERKLRKEVPFIVPLYKYCKAWYQYYMQMLQNNDIVRVDNVNSTYRSASRGSLTSNRTFNSRSNSFSSILVPGRNSKKLIRPGSFAAKVRRISFVNEPNGTIARDLESNMQQSIDV